LLQQTLLQHPDTHDLPPIALPLIISDFRPAEALAYLRGVSTLNHLERETRIELATLCMGSKYFAVVLS